MDDQTTMTGRQVLDEGLDDWRQLSSTIVTRLLTGDFVTGAALVAAITEAAEESQHHPDLDLRYPHLDVTLTSHDVGGLTQRDIRMARTISALAAERGVEADPSQVSTLDVALDTADLERVRPFWQALLGVSDGDPDEIVDPSGRLPLLWFQAAEPSDAAEGSTEAPAQRFHYDLQVPHDVAQDRIDAALAAGGTMADDTHAPSFWVLADADGNRACICTWQGRD